MVFSHTVETLIRLSQRQTPEYVADLLSLPLAQIKRVELVVRYASGRNCDELCGELGIDEAKLDGLYDEFLRAKYLELMEIPVDKVSDAQQKHLTKLIDVDRGRASVDPKDAELQHLVRQMFSAESKVKSRVLKELANKDDALREKLQKRKEDDELMALAMSDSAENFDEFTEVATSSRKRKSGAGKKSRDPYALLREHGTNGHNFNLDTNQIIGQLDKWSSICKFEIVAASHDWVELKFSRLPKDLFAFAESISAFCPDTIDQGFMSQEALIEYLARSKSLKLWWD